MNKTFYLKFPPPLQEAQKSRPGLRGLEISAATGQRLRSSSLTNRSRLRRLSLHREMHTYSFNLLHGTSMFP